MTVRLRWALLLTALLLAGGAVRAQVGWRWTYQGLDSLNYWGGAQELFENQRYAVRLPPAVAPPDQPPPLTHGRPPGYSLFLALISGDAVRACDPRPAKAAQIALDLLTALVTLWMGLRLGGRRVGLLAMGLVLLHPFLIISSASIMTETLATFLTTLVLALLLAALGAPGRRRGLLFLAGAAAGASMLVRPDAVLLLPCLLVPALVLRGARLRSAATALLGCALVFGPWPARNLLRFGAPHALAMADGWGQGIDHDRFMSWFATWLTHEDELPDTLWCFLVPNCGSVVIDFPDAAFADPQERQQLREILALRQQQGLSKEVSDGLAALGAKRARSRPLHTFLVLPARRIVALWSSRNDAPVRNRCPPLLVPLRRGFRALTITGAVLGLLGLLRMRAGRPAQRQAGILFAVAILGRTLGLAYATAVEGRYLFEVLPLVLLATAMLFAARKGQDEAERHHPVLQ